MFDTMDEVTLLIDGDNLLHRVYHIAKLSPDPTIGKMLGSMFRSINAALNKDDYTHICITWDGNKTDNKPFRQKILDKYNLTYKLGREHDPEIYRLKLLTIQACHVCGIPQLYSTTGFESDDIIGSIATKLSVLFDSEVHLLSSDKDMIQVISDKVSIIHPKKGMITKNNCYSLMGIEAHQMVGYLVMVGDTADSIPGVKGIGHKTAVSLLEKYGSVSTILKNVEDLPTATKRAFLTNPISISDLGKLIKLNDASLIEFFSTHKDLKTFYTKKMCMDRIRSSYLDNRYDNRKQLCLIDSEFGKMYGVIQKLAVSGYNNDIDGF